MKALTKLNSFVVFSVFSIINIVVIYIQTHFIITDEHYYNFLGEQHTYSRISQLLELTQKWQTIGLALVPVALIVKLLLISGIIKTGVLLTDSKIKFSDIFQSVLFAESVFIFAGIIKTVWLSGIAQNMSLEEIQRFSPLSLYSLLNFSDSEKWLIYPFQVINIFEVFYWFALGYFLKLRINVSYKTANEITLLPYLLGLLVWVICVIFITVNLS